MEEYRMGSYDNRRLTLDPGLTALALRGLHERDAHYPFLDRFVHWRRSPRRGRTTTPRLSWWRLRPLGSGTRA